MAGTVNFKGFKETERLFKQFDKKLKPVVEKCLKKTGEMITPDLERDIKPHHRSGRTERSLDTDNKVEWMGTEASMPVGFHIRKGGLASVFLMYGTARHAPNNRGISQASVKEWGLYDDIYGRDKEIEELQKRIFDEGVKDLKG